MDLFVVVSVVFFLAMLLFSLTIIRSMTRKQRRNEILNSLREVDRLSPRELLLADKIIELEDALLEMQDAYSSLLALYQSCARAPF